MTQLTKEHREKLAGALQQAIDAELEQTFYKFVRFNNFEPVAYCAMGAIAYIASDGNIGDLILESYEFNSTIVYRQIAQYLGVPDFEKVVFMYSQFPEHTPTIKTWLWSENDEQEHSFAEIRDRLLDDDYWG